MMHLTSCFPSLVPVPSGNETTISLTSNTFTLKGEGPVTPLPPYRSSPFPHVPSSRSPELGHLIQTTRSIINVFSKAKAAKLIRELVDRFLDMEATTGKEVSH